MTATRWTATEIRAAIRGALASGKITQEQYDEQMLALRGAPRGLQYLTSYGPFSVWTRCAGSATVLDVAEAQYAVEHGIDPGETR